MRRLISIGIASGLACWPSGFAHASPTLPPGFVMESVTPGQTFVIPTSIAFLPDGRMLVGEMRGRVYIVENGVKRATPLWSAETEVLHESDRGLMSIAVDPQFAVNGRVYFAYVVDPDTNDVDDNANAFGRVTRYAFTTPTAYTLDPASRTILLGVDWPNGSLSDEPSHAICSLRFGTDGSLLVSIGDGASYDEMDGGGLDATAFGPGRTSISEDIGAFRAQDLNSLCGKILRIDPQTGLGYASNPFATGDLTSVRSRVWAYGFRNPFRFSLSPNTGDPNPSNGDPGKLLVGDVGWALFEEIDIVKPSNRNFGWPCNEGPNPEPAYQAATPAHHDCASIGSPENPAPVITPVISWHHWNTALSTPQGFKGNAVAGTVVYTGSTYPAEYQSALFYADFGQHWIRTATFDASDALVETDVFALDMDAPVDMVTHPVTGDIHYVSITASEVRRIRYAPSPPGSAPVAVANGTPLDGDPPLVVEFSSAGTFDPDGDSFYYVWTFGDGEASGDADPIHTYTMPGVHHAILHVIDSAGRMGRDTMTIVVEGLTAFPNTAILDNFDRTDGPVGSTWLDQSFDLAVQDSALILSGNNASSPWGGAQFGPEQEAYVTINQVSVTSPEQNLMLKVQGDHWYDGHIEIRYDATLTRIVVATYSPNEGWRHRGTIEPMTLADGDQLGARAFSNGIVHVFVNGENVGSASVAAWSYHKLGGRIGLTLSNADGARLDNFGGGNYVTNTAPSATILAPEDSGFYAEGDTIALVGQGTDVETASLDLDYQWQVNVHHNNHVHPGAPLPGPNASVVGHNHDDGTGVHLVAVLTVTDAGGLVDTARVHIYPEVDLQPTSVNVTPETPGTATNAEYRFWIRNHGRMPSAMSRWALTADGYVLAQGDTVVPPRDSVEIAVVLAPALPAGDYTLRARVDSLGTVHETAETNNNANRMLTVVPGSIVDVGQGVPAALSLAGPFPNPSRGKVGLDLGLPIRSPVRFAVYDIQGREIWAAAEKEYGPGWWRLEWNGQDRRQHPVRPGLYLARVLVGGKSFSKSVAVVR